MIEFKGQCKGVRLFPRGLDDPHISLQTMTEDDGQWIPGNEGRMSSFWIDELISVLEQAREFIKTQTPEEHGFGYRFKE